MMGRASLLGVSVDGVAMELAKFDPISVENAIVSDGLLPERVDPPAGELGPLEALFTDKDLRKYALWRISMVRQFQPSVLRQLTNDDLIYLAGQSPEGYVGSEHFGIQLDRNKIAQNSLRARIELDIRTARGTWRRTLLLSLGTFLLGLFSSGVTLWFKARFGGS
jgi:hypothetical protein